MWRKGLLSGKEFQELVAMNKCNNAHFANVLRGGRRDRFRSQRNARSFRLLNFNHVTSNSHCLPNYGPGELIVSHES